MGPARIAFAVVVVAYPLIVYFGLGYFETRIIALVIIVVAMARLLLIRKIDGKSKRTPQSTLVIAALLVVGILGMATNAPILLQYYPVCMNALMFALFTVSLYRPPSIIEQFARIRSPNLPEAAIPYTRKVTMVWCGFFLVNGAMALYTTIDTNIGFWAVYNGLISYSLMGLLFAVEYLVRRRVQRGIAQHQGKKGWQ